MSSFTATRTISMTSGKGGVGKTILVSNLAYELGRRGHRVLILDGDMGMANVDIMFGHRTRLNISHVLESRCQIDDIVVSVAPNVQLIPGGSGIYGLSRLAPLQKHLLLDQVSRMKQSYDYLIIDTAPGIDDNVLYLNAAAQEIMVVVTPDPSSLTDAYALIKVLNTRYRENRFSIVANMVSGESEGQMVFKKISDVAARFLNVSLNYRGFVPIDPILRQSTRSQELVVQARARCPASMAIVNLAENLSHSRGFNEAKGGLQYFWNQLSGVA